MATGLSKKIKALQFAFLSPDEVRRMSAVKIITADTYDDDGYPIEMGLMDLHLGVIEPNLRCRTCGGRVNECPGHFGIIELAMPVIHVGYAKEIKRLLQGTCRACGRKLPDAPAMRAEAISDSDDAAPAPRPREPKEERRLPALPRGPAADHPRQAHHVPRDRPQDHPEGGPRPPRADPGRGRPRDGPEPEVRPARVDGPDRPPGAARPGPTLDHPRLGGAERGRPHAQARRRPPDQPAAPREPRHGRPAARRRGPVGTPPVPRHDLLRQPDVRNPPGAPPVRAPAQDAQPAAKGKDGRFRSNLSGKRVNFSARTVISPDPLLSINDVGIPVEVARALTVPLEVTPHNQEIAKELVKRGPDPAARTATGGYQCGVNYLIREDGQRIKVMDKNAEACAELVAPGCIVERQLIDGDIVLFNRQPSLHRMSMMAHFVRILPHKTFRFNLCDCPPYNADFDGDEMNLHVLQSQEARAEAKVLMKVEEHILSPRYGGPIIGMLHDHITAAFLLTYQNPTFHRAEVTYLLSKLRFPTPPPVGIDKDGEPVLDGEAIVQPHPPEGPHDRVPVEHLEPVRLSADELQARLVRRRRERRS